MCYWNDTTGGSYSLERNFPIVMHQTSSTDESYRHYVIYPSLEYPGMVKVARRPAGAPTPRGARADVARAQVSFNLLISWCGVVSSSEKSCSGLIDHGQIYLVSSRLVSSRLVSSRLVSSRLVSSRLVSFRLVSSHLLFSSLILFYILSYLKAGEFRKSYCVRSSVTKQHILYDIISSCSS